MIGIINATNSNIFSFHFSRILVGLMAVLLYQNNGAGRRACFV